MSLLELYFKTDMTLDELSQNICAILNVGDCEKREGANRGGEYYDMMISGFNLEVLSNKGEVEISERSDWQYYMLVYSDGPSLSEGGLRGFCDHAAELFNSHNIEPEVDSLT